MDHFGFGRVVIYYDRVATKSFKINLVHLEDISGHWILKARRKLGGWGGGQTFAMIQNGGGGCDSVADLGGHLGAQQADLGW